AEAGQILDNADFTDNQKYSVRHYSPGVLRPAPALGAAAASLADGRVEVVALRKTHDTSVLPTAEPGDLWYRWQTTAGVRDWTGSQPLRIPGATPAGLPPPRP